MEYIQNWALRRCLKIAMEKKLEDLIPKIGPEGRAVDCFSVRLRKPVDEDDEYLFRKIDGDKVFLLSWANNLFSKELELPFDEVKGRVFHCDRFLSVHNFVYASPLRMLLFETFRVRNIQVMLYNIKEVILQNLYNRRTPFLDNRIDFLKELISRRNDYMREVSLYGTYTFSHIDLVYQIYGSRVHRHPKYKEFSSEVILNIESLLYTGEIDKSGGNFKLSGKAINTIAEFEIDNRRHKDEMFRGWAMVLLTLIIAAVGFKAELIEYWTFSAEFICTSWKSVALFIADKWYSIINLVSMFTQ